MKWSPHANVLLAVFMMLLEEKEESPLATRPILRLEFIFPTSQPLALSSVGQSSLAKSEESDYSYSLTYSSASSSRLSSASSPSLPSPTSQEAVIAPRESHHGNEKQLTSLMSSINLANISMDRSESGSESGSGSSSESFHHYGATRNEGDSFSSFASASLVNSSHSLLAHSNDNNYFNHHHETNNYNLSANGSVSLAQFLFASEKSSSDEYFFGGSARDYAYESVSDPLSAALSATGETLSDRNMSQLELMLGPVRDPLSTVIPMTIVYSLIFVTGVVGNTATCAVIARNKYMHTATNYYLFSLAVSDLLLLLLGLPSELFMLWQRYPYVFGEPFCIIRAMTSEMSTNASILLITAFTVERYVAICHPLKAHTMSQLSRAVKIIGAIWFIGAAASVPMAFQLGIVYQISRADSTPEPSSAQCSLKRPLPHSFEFATLFFFVIPLCLISVLYVLIGLQLRRSNAWHGGKGGVGGGGTTTGSAHTHASTNKESKSKKSKQSAGEETLIRITTEHGTTTDHTSDSGGARGSNSPDRISTTQTANEATPSHQTGSTHSHAHATAGRSNISSSQASARRSVIKMLFAVVVSFALCWSPFHAQRVLAANISPDQESLMTVYSILTYVSGVTYYLSATMNPILYQLMSQKFRLAFRDTFGPLFRCCCPFCAFAKLPAPPPAGIRNTSQHGGGGTVPGTEMKDRSLLQHPSIGRTASNRSILALDASVDACPKTPTTPHTPQTPRNVTSHLTA